jgi:hypothetical protein
MNEISDSLYQPFSDFFSQPSREKLTAILTQNLGEFDHLDFKAEIFVGSNLAKHILAFANSRGGAIVFGIVENDDRSLDPKGLLAPKDKSEVTRGVRRFVPDFIQYHLLDFAFTESTPLKLKGKTFQVLLVPDNPSHLPFVSQADGDGITEGIVYVRDGTESRPATHTKLQEIINRRLATGHSTSRELTLKEHLDDLETLYNLIPRRIGGGSFMLDSLASAIQRSMIDPGKPNPNYPQESLPQFLNRAIEVKKKVIIDFLRRNK